MKVTNFEVINKNEVNGVTHTKVMYTYEDGTFEYYYGYYDTDAYFGDYYNEDDYYIACEYYNKNGKFESKSIDGWSEYDEYLKTEVERGMNIWEAKQIFEGKLIEVAEHGRNVYRVD